MSNFQPIFKAKDYKFLQSQPYFSSPITTWSNRSDYSPQNALLRQKNPNFSPILNLAKLKLTKTPNSAQIHRPKQQLTFHPIFTYFLALQKRAITYHSRKIKNTKFSPTTAYHNFLSKTKDTLDTKKDRQNFASLSINKTQKLKFV